MSDQTTTLTETCPKCGRRTDLHWEGKAIAEMDRDELVEAVCMLQEQFMQVQDQFLQIAQLNQRILNQLARENAANTHG